MEIKQIYNGEAFLTVFQKFPFEVKRVYYVRGMRPNAIRGRHSHKKTRQALVCVTGKCNLYLKEKTVPITPENYYLLEPEEYHELRDFTDRCRLLVFASEEYDESDYIRKEDGK